MVGEGADILDIGGESTRPGASAVGLQEELDRVIPLLEAVRSRFDLPISIDTSKPGVMREAVAAGASMINDVCALQVDGALEVLAGSEVAVCLMHMQGEPRTMQANPGYRDVVQEVGEFLRQRIEACEAVGISRERICVDPGFGFGKTLQHNLQLLAGLHKLAALEVPLLVGISRKSMIGALLDDAPVHARLNGSLAAAVLAAERGASIVRVHDVKATREVLQVTQALMEIEHASGVRGSQNR